MPPLTQDIGISVSEFTLAHRGAKPRLGVLQPLAGARAVRWGFRPIMMVGGSLLSISWVCLLAAAHGKCWAHLGAGLLISTSLACTAPAMAMSVASRAVRAAVRSTVLGMVSAAGSLGALLSAPIGQVLKKVSAGASGVAGFVICRSLMLPAAWYAGKVDKSAARPPTISAKLRRGAAKVAFGNASFMVMTCAYFVCGMQLVFLTTHLPSYLAICGWTRC